MNLLSVLFASIYDRHFRDLGNVRHPTSKLLKCDLVQNLNTFRNPSLQILVTGNISLVCHEKHTYTDETYNNNNWKLDEM